MTRQISAGFIEHIHDVLVGTFLPFDETIQPGEYRNRALIESAVGRPFQTAFSQEVWPTLSEKAAALFHALACNHCFFNGNKRTAVIALDLFLSINKHVLIMNSDEVYGMAKATVQANKEGISLKVLMAELVEKIESSSIDIALLTAEVEKQPSGVYAEKIDQYARRMIQFVLKLSETFPNPTNAS